MTGLRGGLEFEVIIVEDGSEQTCEGIVDRFGDELSIKYFIKPNTGPGDSRNYGMRRAAGDYFLILDSDCILPEDYLIAVDRELESAPVDCFGGPDRGHPEFSAVQQAVNFAMTSSWTTGGIRGKKQSIDRFQPRSFNMGLSREAFERSGGFGTIHPGEDPELVMRLWELGLNSRLFPGAWVIHKRRIDLNAFLRQVYRFGLARPVLNHWHKGSGRVFYWFPTFFLLGLLAGIAEFLLFRTTYLLGIYGLYLIAGFVFSWMQSGSIQAGLLSIPAILVQFCGYGWGFLKSWFLINFNKKAPEDAVPELFRFKKIRSD